MLIKQKVATNGTLQRRGEYGNLHPKTTKSFSENYIVRTMSWIDLVCNDGFYISVAVNNNNKYK